MCELSVLGQVLISGMLVHFQESNNSFYEGEFLEKSRLYVLKVHPTRKIESYA